MMPHEPHPLTLLVNPDWRRLPAPGRFRTEAPYFPLELMYIEGGLKQRSLPCVMADMWAGTLPPEVLEAMLPQAAFIVITTAPTYIFWRDGIGDVAFPIAEIARLRRLAPQAKIIAVGPQGTALPHSLAEAELDYLICGEPDLVVPELIAGLVRGDTDMEQLPGVCPRRDGRLEVHPVPAVVEDLNQLPLLEFDSILPGVYAQPAYEAGRGCPYSCSFCFRTGFRERLRIKRPERIRIELERLSQAGYKFLALIDEIFGTNPRWLEEFCKIIAPLGFGWGIQTRSECLTPERIGQLVQAGCISIEFGLESADPEVSRAIGKKTDYDQLAENVRAACELGIRQVRLFCIFGSPGETADSIRKTEDYLLQFAELPAVQADVFPMLPLPGTGVWKAAVANGYPLNGWADVGRFEGVIENAFKQPAQVRQACARFGRKWEYARLRRPLSRTLGGRIILGRMWLTIRFPALMGLRKRLTRK